MFRVSIIQVQSVYSLLTSYLCVYACAYVCDGKGCVNHFY